MKSIYEAYLKVVANQQQTVVTETTLSAGHQEKVDEYEGDYMYGEISDHTHEKIHAALGDKNFTHFPIGQSHADADPDVIEHLSNHGYDIDDYVKGIAAKKVTVGNPERGIPLREKVVKQSIGSILKSTNAEPHVVKAFNHDPIRTSTKTGDLHCVITRTPYGVAGMSTGTPWSSCMNLDTGANSHYIPHDIGRGTHVAYLVKSDDKTAFEHGEPSHPLGRIALKPFHLDGDEEADTIFRPESKHYGNTTHAFVSDVSKWAIEKYPAKAGETYHKNRHVYDDSGEDEYTAQSLDDVKEKLDNEQPIVDGVHGMMDHHIIDGAIHHIKTMPQEMHRDSIDRVLSVGNLTSKHVIDLHKISKALPENQPRHVMWQLAHRAGNKFSTNMHNEFIQHGFSSIPNMLAMSPKLPAEQVDKLPNDKLSMVRRSLIKPHHIDKVVNSLINGESGSYYSARDMSWAMNSQHIDKLVDAGMHGGTNTFISQHPQMTKETFDKAWDKSTDEQKLTLLGSHHATYHKHYEPLKGYNKAFTTFSANPNITEEDKRKLANTVVDVAMTKGFDDQRRPSIASHIGDDIGKHLTDAHYEKLATNQRFIPSFSNPEHSWKYIDAAYKNAKATDLKLDNGELENEDTHWNTLGHYHDALQSHIDNHVLNNGTVQNHDELYKVQDRLEDHYSAFNHDGDQFYDMKNNIRDYE